MLARLRMLAGLALLLLGAGSLAAQAPTAPRPAGPPPPAPARQKSAELLFYMSGSEDSFRSFRDHVRQITVVAPQSFSVDEHGVVWGEVDPRVLPLAKANGVKVIPLVVNPGFNQTTIHALLDSPVARARAVRAFVELARENGFDGWQFDFENIAITDRDSLTAFFQETAAALHADGRSLSIAVVPFNGQVPETAYGHYMVENWRGVYDVKALADAGDFLSLMTYAQHTGGTTPGPIADLSWMRRMLERALAEGVPPAKLSLGIPSYSGYWFTNWDAQHGSRGQGREIGFPRARSLLDRYGAQPTWLPAVGASLAYWAHDDVYQWLFLEDRRAFAAKLALLREHPDLRGISVWVLGAEDPAIWQELGRR